MAPLQPEPVQLSTFGRKLAGTANELPGFAQSMPKIKEPDVVATSGETHHPIVAFTGCDADTVSGIVFQITAETSLYRAVQEHIDTFLARAESSLWGPSTRSRGTTAGTIREMGFTSSALTTT